MRLPALLIACMVGTSATAAPGQFWCVKDDHRLNGLHVKAKPQEGAETVMVVGPGRVLVEFASEGEWLNVGISRAKGRDGYVRKDSVQATDLDGLLCGK